MRLEKHHAVEASRGPARFAGLGRHTPLDDGDAGADRSDPIQFSRSAASINPFEPRHLQAIRKLAEEEKWPIDDVGRLYGQALQELGAGATIQDYLILLTCKKVRGAIRQSRKNALQSLTAIPAGPPARPPLRAVVSH